MNRKFFVQNIPNALTTLNLLAGLSAIIFLVRGDLQNPEITVFALVAFCGIVDFFDGFAARRLNASSDFGKQLDSFADLISFGVAPICLLNAIYDLSPAIAVSSAIFVVSGIYRLARYNIGDFSDYFLGLPITVAGMALTAFCAAFAVFKPDFNSAVFTTIFTLVLSVMMVSKVKIKRLKAPKK